MSSRLLVVKACAAGQGKDDLGRDETNHCPDCPPSLSTSASSQEPQVSRAPLPPPLPTVPPVPLRQFQGIFFCEAERSWAD